MLLFHFPDIETNINNYKVIGSLQELDQFNIILRDKREVSVENKPTGSASISSSSGTPTVTATATATKLINDGNQTQPITLENNNNNNNQRLLGVNGTGQRLNITKPAIVSEPLNSDGTKPTTGLTSIKSIPNPNTNVSPSASSTDVDGIIDSIDTSEENVNKTIRQHQNATKEDYYSYYNSTILVDNEESNKYWSDLKNFTISTLLSTSHRRAIVCHIKKKNCHRHL